MGFIFTAFYVAGILSAMHAALTARTAQGAVAWSVSLVTFPFVAVPAYAVFGRNKFEGISQAFEMRADEIRETLLGFESALEPWHVPPAEEPSWYQAIHRMSDFTLLRGNDVTLLINGEATFDSILDGIASAR